MGRITQTSCGDNTGDFVNRTNEAMKTVETDATLSGDGTEGNPLKVENAGGGGVPEAPNDGKQYGRQNEDWTEVVGQVPEAPEDGKTYGRKDATWEEVVTELSGAIAVTGTLVGFNKAEGFIHGKLSAPESGDITLNDQVPALNGTSAFMYHTQALPPTIINNGFTVSVKGRYLPNKINRIVFTYGTDSDVLITFLEQPTKIEQELSIASGVVNWLGEDGLNARLTLTENVTALNVSNVNNDDVLVLRVKQDSTGGRSLAMPTDTVVVSDGQGVIDLSGQGPDVESLITFLKVNNILYATYGLNYTGSI